jgi:hypothetical protein
MPDSTITFENEGKKYTQIKDVELNSYDDSIIKFDTGLGFNFEFAFVTNTEIITPGASLKISLGFSPPLWGELT